MTLFHMSCHGDGNLFVGLFQTYAHRFAMIVCTNLHTGGMCEEDYILHWISHMIVIVWGALRECCTTFFMSQS